VFTRIPTGHDPATIRRAIALLLLLLALLAVGTGALAAVATRVLLPILGDSLFGLTPAGYRQLCRASGFVAYGLLWLSMALGILMTNKLARAWPGGPRALDLHRFVSLLGLGFVLFHILILLGDPSKEHTLVRLFVPFAGYDFMWLGQLCFYLMGVVALSFYLRRRLGNRGWRTVHFLSFALFLLVLAHALVSGSDSSAPLAQGLYWLTAGSLVVPTLYRILATFTK
jgi:predicted ferric reductase